MPKWTRAAMALCALCPMGLVAIPDMSPGEPAAEGCIACIWCASNSHVGAIIQNKPELNIYFHSEHPCEAWGECDAVPECTAPAPSAEELEQAWIELSDLEGAEIEQVAEIYEFVSYNPEREAFQIHVCGATPGHLPLTEEQVSSLVQ